MLRQIGVRWGSVRNGIRAARRMSDCFAPTDTFLKRHIGPSEADVDVMLKTVGFNTLEELTASTVPAQIRLQGPLFLEPAIGESEALAALKKIMSKNVVNKSFIGMGYYETLTPTVILRNMLENPGWYTSYTPYQAEIAQGRLNSLLNFQTMVSDLTGMKMCNSSLLDESTAAAEALSMTYALGGSKREVYLVDKDVHPQTIGVIRTRAEAAGLSVEVVDAELVDFSARSDVCGVLVQYPNTYGVVTDLHPLVQRAHKAGVLVVASTDLMASALLKPVGEMGVDIAVGSAQRFGVPMGYGGPHAGFLATTDAYSRKMPGRLIGVSKDSRGKPALRMAMQTREQHIRRDKATSNICTAQALLANMAAMYGVYHGPNGVKEIATRIHGMACATASTLKQAGYNVETQAFFDTFVVDVSGMGKTALEIQQRASSLGVNVRVIDQSRVGIAFGEAINRADTECLLSAFEVPPAHLRTDFTPRIPPELLRTSEFMTHKIFNTIESETQMLRYLKKLESMDLALNTSMISLGSCTMKLNASTEMIPVTWPEVGNLHPFAPEDQAAGYREMIVSLHKDLAEITGFAAMSCQPNSGANGEYAGLLTIKAYHESRGDPHRNICLIPVSAHGTNPASAAMVGMKVQVIKSDATGDVDLNDLREKVEKHKDNLAALMITYPSTYGKFEEEIKTIIDLVHKNGGQVYMDGANMNAQCGLTSPGHIGADVCHLNLHKTFCIPHGGGGPGVGTIGVAAHLAPFLPGNVVMPCGGEGLNTQVKSQYGVAGAPYGSASILPITWMYIKMLSGNGLKYASQIAILNANYMAKGLEKGYQILYRGSNGQSAHEFIINLQPYKEYGIVEEDVAKRLMDFGFHSPTMSWPVPGTLMVEPTESEDKAELDRFVTAMLIIKEEIKDVISGKIAAADSPLKGAPHTMDMVYADNWNRAYSRTTAAFPAPWTNEVTKFWPTVGRLDNVYGDRNLVCSCPPTSLYE